MRDTPAVTPTVPPSDIHTRRALPTSHSGVSASTRLELQASSTLSGRKQKVTETQTHSLPISTALRRHLGPQRWLVPGPKGFMTHRRFQLLQKLGVGGK